MLHAIVYALFSLQLSWTSWIASQLHPIWWVLMWPALSFALMSLGYMGAGARVMGKQADGTHHPLASLIHVPFRALLWLSTTLFMWRHREAPAWNLVAPGLWLGRKVSPSELPEGVRHVVDMTAEHRGMGEAEGRSYRTLPTLDGCAPDERALRALVSELRGREGDVYVHCLAGRGRSATLVAAILLDAGDARDAEHAESLARQARDVVRLSTPQRRALERLFP